MVSTEINTYAHTQLHLFVCMYTYIAVVPLPFGEISRALFIRMNWQNMQGAFKVIHHARVKRAVLTHGSSVNFCVN